ncbi:aldo/keto reductase [Streptomyces sp. NPDC026672]|uniref:aldo/keto reductase n=1 Tax=unclassified Streptomyces TaxID=2593676 RepID=UPI0033CC6261
MSMSRLGLDHVNFPCQHTGAVTDTPFEETVEILAGMKAYGLIRHISLSNVSADQLRTAISITDIAAVTAHCNVAVRVNAAVRNIAEGASMTFSFASCSNPARH